MNRKLALFVLALSTLGLAGSAGHVVGNGGDYIRNNFFATGQAALRYLQGTDAGRQVLAQNKLDPARLADSLSIEKVSVVDNLLIDNGGSVVDAIGEPGRIVLNQYSWFDHFEKERNIYSLVFHEMLRENAIDDDNYVISSALNQLPQEFRIGTRIAEYIPLIADDLLDGIIDASQIAFSGTGCSAKSGARADFDRERNLLELNLGSYRVVSTKGALARSNCALAIAAKLPAKKRLVISLLDIESQVQLAPNSQAAITTEAFLTGSKAPLKTRMIVSKDKPVQGRVLVRRTEVLQSRCGGSDLLRLNSSITLKALSATETSALQIGKAKLFLRLDDCQ